MSNFVSDCECWDEKTRELMFEYDLWIQEKRRKRALYEQMKWEKIIGFIESKKKKRKVIEASQKSISP